MAIAPILTTLRNNNMLNSASKEVGGSNVPHVLMVANKNEFIDQAINQFGNTAMVFGGGYLLSKVINRLFGLMNKGDFAKTAFKTPASNPWFFLGKAFAIYSFIGSYVVASPFLRNYITSKRTKTSNYTEMVGLAKSGETLADRLERQQKEKEYKRKFLTAIGTGWGISAAILAITQILAKKKPALSPSFQFIEKHLSLPNGDFKQLKNWPTALFWAVPCYAGLYLGSRDKLEKKEIAFRAAGWGLAFMILPITLKNFILKKVAGKTFKVFGPGENLGYLAELASALVFYTSIPTISNLIKRRKRAKEYGLIDPSLNANQKPVFWLSRKK